MFWGPKEEPLRAKVNSILGIGLPLLLVRGSLPQNKHGFSTHRNGNVRTLSLLLLYLLSLLSTSNKGFEFEKLSLIFNPNINRLTLLTLQE